MNCGTASPEQISLLGPEAWVEEQGRELARLRAENQRLRAMTDGTHCPVCDQYCKTYTRPMYGKMVMTLLELHQQVGHRPTFLHLMDFQKAEGGTYTGGGNFSLLAYWGFILAGKDRGMWAITDTGRAFVRNELAVRRAVRIYNDHFLGFDDASPMVRCEDVLQTKFHYTAIMGN